MLTSAIGRQFFLPNGPKKNLITLRNPTSEVREIIKNNARIICSLVEENLNYVNEEWSNWFKDRYILVRYEDRRTWGFVNRSTPYVQFYWSSDGQLCYKVDS